METLSQGRRKLLSVYLEPERATVRKSSEVQSICKSGEESNDRSRK